MIFKLPETSNVIKWFIGFYDLFTKQPESMICLLTGYLSNQNLWSVYLQDTLATRIYDVYLQDTSATRIYDLFTYRIP